MNEDFEDLSAERHRMASRVATLEVASDTYAIKISDHGGRLTAMDKDVSDAQAAFRAQLAVLNSVRETQSEQTRTLREHSGILREHTRALAELRGGLTETRVGIRTIIGLLTPANGHGESGDSPN
jgi:hypothetical protein